VIGSASPDLRIRRRYFVGRRRRKRRSGRAWTVARGTAPEGTSRICRLPPEASLDPFSCPMASVSAGTAFSRSASVCVGEPGYSAESAETPSVGVLAEAGPGSGAGEDGGREWDDIGGRI